LRPRWPNCGQRGLTTGPQGRPHPGPATRWLDNTITGSIQGLQRCPKTTAGEEEEEEEEGEEEDEEEEEGEEEEVIAAGWT